MQYDVDCTCFVSELFSKKISIFIRIILNDSDRRLFQDI